jgi:hypothetical protein
MNAKVKVQKRFREIIVFLLVTGLKDIICLVAATRQ